MNTPLQYRHRGAGAGAGAGTGAALLIVLATLVLVVTAATILVGAAASIQTQTNIDRCTILVDDLLGAADPPVQHWLSTESARIVLPPDSEVPSVHVLHDLWSVGTLDYEVIITAWDQCGMVPHDLIRNGSPLRLALPPEILHQYDGVELKAEQAVGLDLYMDISTDTDPGTLSPYPKSPASEPVMFGSISDRQSEPTVLSIDPVALRLGELIATHNPPPPAPRSTNRGSSESSLTIGAVNVNTAPITLVDAILQLTHRDWGGGLEQIIGARSQGMPATIGGQFTAGALQQQTPQLVASSTVWSFRIDARVGSVRKSWWAVYRPATVRPGSHIPGGGGVGAGGGGWECVQRLVINH